VRAAFAAKPQAGDAAQLAVDPGEQLLERGGIARRVRVQERRDLGAGVIRAGGTVIHGRDFTATAGIRFGSTIHPLLSRKDLSAASIDPSGGTVAERSVMRLSGVGVSALVLAAALIPARAQQPPAAAAPAPAPPAAGRGGGLNDACGGRSQNPREACPNDVTRMIATLGLLPDKPPAAPQKPRKVLIWSRLPSAGFQHSSIPLAAKMIEEMGRKTGAWTSTTSWEVGDITAENLKQYDAIFLSNTTGTFLDDPSDPAVTEARRKAFQDFLMGGKGVAGIHATGDSYHGGRGRRGAGGGAPPAAAAPPAGAAAAPATPPPAAAAGGGRGAPMPCTVPDAQKQERPAEPLWPWWNEAIGGYFKFHWNYPTPITVKIDDPKSPLTAAFRGKSFNTIDEVYTFNESSFSRARVRVLTSVDYSLMSDCDKGIEAYPRKDRDHALSWIQRVGQGRVFYQALGHHESIYYNNPDMLAHILAGMQYVLGDLKADDTPSRGK
jgi:type 1 glutamine amidotransferase